ncbi:MAG: hypothetical protein P8166_11145 [Candidatus Thiodiazotropha sp.]
MSRAKCNKVEGEYIRAVSLGETLEGSILGDRIIRNVRVKILSVAYRVTIVWKAAAAHLCLCPRIGQFHHLRVQRACL